MTPASLHILLLAVVSGRASGQQVSLLVGHAYQLALVRVRQLSYSGRLHLRQHPLSHEALAFDCIAELFSRDEDGAYTELTSAFDGAWELSQIDAIAASSRFRSLVFTHLQQGLIRTYKELDPVFSKVLRNIRLALRTMRGVFLYERLGMPMVSPVPPEERLEELPELTFHDLQTLAAPLPPGIVWTRPFLEHVLQALRVQSTFRRTCHLFDLTLVLKHHLVRERVPLESIAIESDPALHLDIRSLVEEGLDEVLAHFHESYVVSGKVAPGIFEHYAGAVKDLVDDLFVHNDGQDLGHPDYLMARMPSLTRERYREEHRHYFEYMVKTARKTIGARLRELMG